jgi:23S rRNA (adenine2030-N6)-methyltransferase
VIAEDGYHALKSQLPPPERRALVLVDPPFEVESEFLQIAKALEGAVTRFPTGLYLVWLPLKDRKAIDAIYGEVQTARIRDVTALEWHVRDPIADVGLTGSVLMMINAPFTLQNELSAIMPWMTRVLTQGPGARWELRRVTPE